VATCGQIRFSFVLVSARISANNMNMTLEPILVATGDDCEGRLVFRDGWLVAVLVQLSAQHDEQEGFWYLEKGFGALDGPDLPSFESLEQATAWIADHFNDAPPFTQPAA